jgi:hypothetical protein
MLKMEFSSSDAMRPRRQAWKEHLQTERFFEERLNRFTFLSNRWVRWQIRAREIWSQNAPRRPLRE